ncbi:hypothetical protein M409DRAFT_50902 [Zasmidium cellare ATCC 36951]|uniref:DUF6590 domain-containing protein n=1 Tax=Zasmidium cellare ATCC 36951 TaxID=1080233 RepID=A0A6A6D1E8_ZASCE|nr:uncharacterized protein M409DRAFT_50902 [Zasmidium cellare ATCC 36951]KAF2171466.1 hypothetical protein M409DRAFT_50902 [Zasmidium cellare ATCC 36951]
MWRGETRHPSTSHHSHSGGSHYGGTGRRRRYKSRYLGGGFDIDEVTPGAIMFHREVVVNYNDAVAARQAPQVGSMYVFQTNSGHWYIEKGRYFHVIKVFDRHWTECPIYTYQGQGLENKSPQLKEEHVGLKPMHLALDEYEPQNEVQVRTMRNPKERLSEKAVIHFTEARSSNFNTRIRAVGFTDGNGVNLIAELRKKMGCV